MTNLIEINPDEQYRDSWYGMQAGTVLVDRYRIERLISRGGMGAVFEATQLGLDRPVAIKMLLPTLSRDAKVQERFRREARSVASLQHPNIIQIYDYGISDHGPYIVMEFLRGQSLRQMLRPGPLPVEHAVELVEQVCSAVSAAHARGIIHRDLKPDNIIIEQQENGRVTAKVLDFGIAKIREAQAEEDDANLTGANLIGSPAYMSPEQSLGHELDARSDVYSLGILFYEMLAGGTPFGKASSRGMLMHQLHSQPRPIGQMRGEITLALEEVVMKALAKERELRFASADEFGQAVRSAYRDSSLHDTQLCGESTLDITETFSTNANTTLPGPSHSGILATPHRRRLAILPLRNLAGEQEIEFLGFALADTVITQLAPLKSLIVRPSSAVEKYRNQAIDPRTVGRELQVETILSGSYLKAGDMFRVNVQLIDVQQNEILWQERIDMKFDNVISLQDRICEELINGLRLNITTDEQEAIKRDEAQNPIAYELYLRGLACDNSTEEHSRALQMLETSVGLDASYAPAWAALAGRYINARGYLRDERMLDKAEAAARKALELNPQLPAALFWLAVYHGEKGDLIDALTICRQLLQAAPNSEYAYQAMGHAYDYAGLPDIALALFRKAAEINPMTYPYMIGFIHYQKGDLKEARREFETKLNVCNEMPYWLSVVDFIEGSHEKAIGRLEALAISSGGGFFNILTSALLCSFSGKKEEGKKILDDTRASGVRFASYHYFLFAQIYSQLGDQDSALEMLRGAIKTGYANYPFLSSDPLLAPARETPGFNEIAGAMRKLQTQLQLMLVTG